MQDHKPDLSHNKEGKYTQNTTTYGELTKAKGALHPSNNSFYP